MPVATDDIIMCVFLITSLAVAAVMLPLDFVWLQTMNWFYRREMGDLLLAEPRLWIALVFYIVLAAALAFFAVIPNLGQSSWTMAGGYGAFFGLAAYGTYDATNHATLKGFPIDVMAVDWLRGTCLCAVAASAIDAADGDVLYASMAEDIEQRFKGRFQLRSPDLEPVVAAAFAGGRI